MLEVQATNSHARWDPAPIVLRVLPTLLESFAQLEVIVRVLLLLHFPALRRLATTALLAAPPRRAARVQQATTVSVVLLTACRALPRTDGTVQLAPLYLLE